MKRHAKLEKRYVNRAGDAAAWHPIQFSRASDECRDVAGLFAVFYLHELEDILVPFLEIFVNHTAVATIGDGPFGLI